MKELKEFTIPFIGLKLGEHLFDYQIDNTFFEHFEFEDFNKANILVEVELNKKTTILEFALSIKGHVNVNCDITNEPYDQKIEGDYQFIVKFGETYNDDNEELLILPHGSHEVNIQQYIYETVVLNVPIRKTHPGIEDGTLKSDIIQKLEELSPKETKDNLSSKSETTDPRWDQLKKLLTDKKIQ
jgi:uncharacterized metal-binding protein YceD (DUF177 family)